MISTETKIVKRQPVQGKKKQRKQKKKSKKSSSRRNGAVMEQSVGVAHAMISTTYEPEISQSQGPRGPCRVKHREFLADLTSVAANDYQRLFEANINPGDPGCFPWFSEMARRYEKYIPHSLSFFFASSQSSATPGVVMVVAEFEANDLFPSSKVNFLNQKGAVRCAPWQNARYVVDPKDLKQRSQYYVTTGSVKIQSLPAGEGPSGADDPRLDNVGKIFVACQNVAADTPLGELWVEYDIELLTPQMGNDPNGVVFHSNSTTLGVTAAQPLGIDPLFSGKLDIDYTVASGGGQSTFVFSDVGRYFLALDIDATTIAGLQVVLAAPVGGGDAPSFVPSIAGTTNESTITGTSNTLYTAFDVPSNGGRVTITTTTLSTMTSVSVSILRISSGYTPY